MAEHRDEVVVLEDFPLDLFGQSFALVRLVGCEVFFVLGVEIFNAELVGGEHAAAFELRLVPIGPARANAGAGEDDVDPGPLLHPALPALEADGPLQSLQPGPDADCLELRADRLAGRAYGLLRV